MGSLSEQTTLSDIRFKIVEYYEEKKKYKRIK